MKDNIIVSSICEYIKERILSKEMFPGYRIVEDEIANELGVSRTPLRRALTQLQYEGFLYIVPNRGTFVVQSNYEDIKQIYEARACIEDGIAAGIIKNVVNSDIDELKAIYNKLNKLKDNYSIAEYSTLNKEFHMRLVNISKNEYLNKFLEEIHNRVSLLLVYYYSSLNNDASSTTHSSIIEALKDRNCDALIRAMRDDAQLADYDMHRIRSTQSYVLNIMEQQDE